MGNFDVLIDMDGQLVEIKKSNERIAIALERIADAMEKRG